MIQIDFNSFASGRMAELLKDALADVARNIQDENTAVEKKRQIVMTMTIEPTKDRQLGLIDIQVKTKLAAPLSAPAFILMQDDGEEIYVKEIVSESDIPGQIVMTPDGDIAEPGNIRTVRKA